MLIEFRNTLKDFLRLQIIKFVLLIILCIISFLCSAELLFATYETHLYKIDNSDDDLFYFTQRNFQIAQIILISILNLEWILLFIAHGKQYIYEFHHLINGFIVLAALILDCKFKGRREIEAVIGLIFIRLIRLLMTIYEVTNIFDEKQYEDLETKFFKLDNQLQNEIDQRKELDIEINQLKVQIDDLKKQKQRLKDKKNI